MMENYLDIIILLYEVSEAEHYPNERPGRYQKLDSHISMLREALFLYK